MNKKKPEDFTTFLAARHKSLAGIDVQKLLLASLAGIAEGRHRQAPPELGA